MAIKHVEVITGIKSYDTQILIDGKDIAQEAGVYGIDIRLRVNEVPQMVILSRGLNTKFVCESCDVKFKFDKGKLSEEEL